MCVYIYISFDISITNKYRNCTLLNEKKNYFHNIKNNNKI